MSYFAPRYVGQKLVAVDRYRRIVNSVARSIDSVHRDNQVVVGSLALSATSPVEAAHGRWSSCGSCCA